MGNPIDNRPPQRSIVMLALGVVIGIVLGIGIALYAGSCALGGPETYV